VHWKTFFAKKKLGVCIRVRNHSEIIKGVFTKWLCRKLYKNAF